MEVHVAAVEYRHKHGFPDREQIKQINMFICTFFFSSCHSDDYSGLAVSPAFRDLMDRMCLEAV